jgi:V/A-type H+-transporting ATPase subunit I
MEGHKLFPDGFGGFFTEAFFETFETVLSYITNTMSFLRVGGFVLSHAGMMMVVFSLMDMFGPLGATITFILGNLFVMGLEGLIVGIQVLRLEFYEMFSRYFEGNGIPFKYNE